eukprot:7109610-Lingulodinium_polyedra.AAC.1
MAEYEPVPGRAGDLASPGLRGVAFGLGGPPPPPGESRGSAGSPLRRGPPEIGPPEIGMPVGSIGPKF